MKANIIPLQNLALSFIPVIILIFVFFKWKLNWKGLIYASGRMLSQLLMIGYLLTYIFKQNNPWWTTVIVLIMLTISAWISLYSVKHMRREKLLDALISLFVGATPVLFLVTVIVIPSNAWYEPSFFIPLAGMVFSNAMNTIGVAAERFNSEIKRQPSTEAKRLALSAALIPQLNSFMAVGLVSLPGMMTGQILSGVDPLIAVRYQIVVMTMVMGAGGLSAAIFLQRHTLIKATH